MLHSTLLWFLGITQRRNATNKRRQLLTSSASDRQQCKKVVVKGKNTYIDFWSKSFDPLNAVFLLRGEFITDQNLFDYLPCRWF